ncbi:hypothetical protein [Aestuariivivens sp. NBU2969]|uniref:hypothetical protein n=1 Tax=Aestuariivivens sp. NBU2969 TaxID=2873267 RepID=UPI001CBB06E1|nr:hypothetical protein [Aestuariivivens sp. NBU2969]
MRKMILILFLMVSLVTFSQSEKVVGDYKITLGNKENHLIEYKLVLNRDHTFFFRAFTEIKKGIPSKVNTYGKGTWAFENNIVSFSADKTTDFNDKYTLDFNNTQARFVTKSPRDKTNRDIKTKLRFFKSNIFWMQRIDLFKE